MQQRCCCYQCKQDPYYSLWMRCSSVVLPRDAADEDYLTPPSFIAEANPRKDGQHARLDRRERERERKKNSMYVCTYQSCDVFCRS
jgi:hypothetical protein